MRVVQIETEELVRGWSPEFRERFTQLVQSIGRIKDVADLVGVTPKQVSKWRDGYSKISLADAYVICEAAGRKLDWLIGGADADIKSIDMVLLEHVMVDLETSLHDLNLDLPSEIKAKLIFLLYKFFSSNNDSVERAGFKENLLKVV